MKYDKKVHMKSDGRRLMSGGPRDLQRRLQQQEGPVISSGNAVIEELRSQIRELTVALTQKSTVSAEDFDKELRTAVADAVKETKKEYSARIESLERELSEPKESTNEDVSIPSGMLTPEQLDEEINKATAEILAVAEETAASNIKKVEATLTSIINEKANELDGLTAMYEKLVLASDNEILRFQDKLDALENAIRDKEKTISVLEEKTSVPLDINDERIAELVAQKIAIDSDGGVYDPNQPKMETVFIDPSEASAEDKLEGTIEAETFITEEKENVADKAEKLKNLIGKLPKVV